MLAPDLELENLEMGLNCLKISSTLQSSQLELNIKENDKLERKRSREVAYKFYDFPKMFAQDKFSREVVNYKGKQVKNTNQHYHLPGSSVSTEQMTVYSKASFTFNFINEENDLRDKKVTKKIKPNVLEASVPLKKEWLAPKPSKL